MAVRDDFTAGEVLAAADLNDTFGAKLNLAGGKILQIVRATDATQRSTTSTSFVDVTGMSVTITPQFTTSKIIVLASGACRSGWTTETVNQYGEMQITTSANVALSGADSSDFGLVRQGTNAGGTFWLSPFLLLGYIEPNSVSAQTYKMRFLSGGASTTVVILNNETVGQMYAIEVSA